MKKQFVFLGTVALAISAPVIAQDIFGEPNSATVILEANFPDDPNTVDVISGGEINVSTVVDGCNGYISDAPDVRLNFTTDESPSAFPLYIYATSDEDTTLLINAPDGSWYCNDDGNSGTNPSVVFGPAMAGDYEIWVGSYDEGTYHEAKVGISELEGQ